MGKCEVCGNEYDDLIEVKLKKNGIVHLFDSFECAVHRLAPECGQCGVRVVGHGVQVDDLIFCGAHCARRYGFNYLVDRAKGLLAQQ